MFSLVFTDLSMHMIPIKILKTKLRKFGDLKRTELSIEDEPAEETATVQSAEADMPAGESSSESPGFQELPSTSQRS